MMATIQLVHDHYDAAHLDDVKETMQIKGSPCVKAVNIEGDLWVALEGCHRIRAAADLGIPIEIDEFDLDDDMPADLDVDWVGTLSDLVESIRMDSTVAIDTNII